MGFLFNRPGFFMSDIVSSFIRLIKLDIHLAINTGGGDAPGLNAVIHGAVYAARGLGWQVLGIREGYDGLLEPDRYPNGGLVELHRSIAWSNGLTAAKWKWTAPTT